MIRIVAVVVQQASFPIRVSKGLLRRWSRALPLFVCGLALLGGCASVPPPAPVPPPRYAAAARLVPPDGVISCGMVRPYPCGCGRPMGMNARLCWPCTGLMTARTHGSTPPRLWQHRGLRLLPPTYAVLGPPPCVGAGPEVPNWLPMHVRRKPGSARPTLTCRFTLWGRAWGALCLCCLCPARMPPRLQGPYCWPLLCGTLEWGRIFRWMCWPHCFPSVL